MFLVLKDIDSVNISKESVKDSKIVVEDSLNMSNYNNIRGGGNQKKTKRKLSGC